VRFRPRLHFIEHIPTGRTTIPHATPINVNTDLTAYFFIGHLDSTDPAADAWEDLLTVSQ
jgi:hypothetical protein